VATRVCRFARSRSKLSTSPHGNRVRGEICELREDNSSGRCYTPAGFGILCEPVEFQLACLSRNIPGMGPQAWDEKLMQMAPMMALSLVVKTPPRAHLGKKSFDGVATRDLGRRSTISWTHLACCAHATPSCTRALRFIIQSRCMR